MPDDAENFKGQGWSRRREKGWENAFELRCANFCGVCGGESWHLRGTDVDTCPRGHHIPCERGHA
jgi:hypothetical protein